MPVDGYVVAFDASQNFRNILGVCAIPFVVGVLGATIGWGLRESGEVQQASKGTFFLMMSVVWFGFSFVILFAGCAEYYRSVAALSNHEYHIAEGTVTDYVPMPPEGNSVESFKVGSTSFRYRSATGLVVFNSRRNRGYIHEGAQVRISYKDADILRIEVK